MGDCGVTAESLYDYCMTSPGPLQDNAERLLELGCTSRSLLRPGITEQLVLSGIPRIAAFDIVQEFASRFRPGIVGIFWDYTSVNFEGGGVSPLHAITALRERLSIFGAIQEMKIFVAQGQLDDRHAVALQDAGASLISVPKIRKRGEMVAYCDKPLLADALIFAYTALKARDKHRALYSHVKAQSAATSADATPISSPLLTETVNHLDPVVVIISDDPDQSPLLSKLKSMGVRSVVVTSDRPKSGRIVFGCSTASLTWPSSFLSSFMIPPSSPARQAMYRNPQLPDGAAPPAAPPPYSVSPRRGSPSSASSAGRQPNTRSPRANRDARSANTNTNAANASRNNSNSNNGQDSLSRQPTTPQQNKQQRQQEQMSEHELAKHIVVQDASPANDAAAAAAAAASPTSAAACNMNARRDDGNDVGIVVEQPSPVLSASKKKESPGKQSATPQRQSPTSSSTVAAAAVASPQLNRRQHQAGSEDAAAKKKSVAAASAAPGAAAPSVSVAPKPKFVSLASSSSASNPLASLGITWKPLLAPAPETKAKRSDSGTAGDAAISDNNNNNDASSLPRADPNDGDEKTLDDLEEFDALLQTLHAVTGAGEISRAQCAIEVANNMGQNIDFGGLIRRAEAAGLVETGGRGFNSWISRRNTRSMTAAAAASSSPASSTAGKKHFDTATPGSDDDADDDDDDTAEGSPQTPPASKTAPKKEQPATTPVASAVTVAAVAAVSPKPREPSASASPSATSPRHNKRHQQQVPPQKQTHSTSPFGGGAECWMSFRLNKHLPASAAVLQHKLSESDVSLGGLEVRDLAVVNEDGSATDLAIRAFGPFRSLEAANDFLKSNFARLPYRPRYFAKPPNSSNAVLHK